MRIRNQTIKFLAHRRYQKIVALNVLPALSSMKLWLFFLSKNISAIQFWFMPQISVSSYAQCLPDCKLYLSFKLLYYFLGNTMGISMFLSS